MLKNTGYQEKIEILKPWLSEIVDVVKKDLKSEHLKIDKGFCKKYFLGKNPLQLNAADLAPAYIQDISEGNVGLAEFIATRWLLKNTDLYGFFEERLKSITPDFEAIDELPEQTSRLLLEEALRQFDATRIYIFSVFNSVVFPKSTYDFLEDLAKKKTTQRKFEERLQEDTETLEGMKKRHMRELNAINDRFEKKMSGLQKKYIQDTENLKKQIALLHRKIAKESDKA